MFQFLRRVSVSLIPRPDRPWREDATSHAPTIGRKRRYSLTDRDTSDLPVKRTKNDSVGLDTACDAASEGDALSPGDVKDVTKGVEEVDLEDKDKAEDTLLVQPEGIPLPDSPSASPEPQSESPELAASDVLEETKGEEHPHGEALDDAEEGAQDRTEAESVTTNLDTSVEEVTVSDLHNAPETLE